MAIIATSNYAGKHASKFISPAIFKAPTIADKNMTIWLNVKDSINIQLANLGTVIQVDGCDFNASGDITLSEKKLSVTDLKVNLKYCKTTLENTFLSEEMRAGALNSAPPASFESWFNAYLTEKVGANIETLVWRSDTAGVGGIYTDAVYKQFVGLEPAIRRSATSKKVQGTSGVTATATVFDEFEKFYLKFPVAVRNKPSFKVFAHPDIVWAFGIAASKVNGDNSAYLIGDKIAPKFGGINIVEADLPAYTMIATMSENIHFGTDLLSDYNAYEVILPTDGSDNVLVKMRFKVGTQIVNDSEIAIYSPSVTSN